MAAMVVDPLVDMTAVLLIRVVTVGVMILAHPVATKVAVKVAAAVVLRAI
tara:strand:- start:569 stop:718 length:150 start_codon:yes stop_codon:yes gene_type:complete